jgi:hypothetical protein
MGTAEKQVGRCCSTCCQNVCVVEAAQDDGRAASGQGRHHAEHDPVDVEQRQDKQNARRGRDIKRREDLPGHRSEVGMVEHDALRAPGRAAGVHEQGQIAGSARGGRGPSRPPASSSSMTRTSARGSFPAEAASKITTFAPESASWQAASAAVSTGLTGVTAPPIRQAANSVSTISTQFGSLVATTSPARTPSDASPPDSLSTAAASLPPAR